MQLDKQQKEDLKSLTEHRGFKILEAIYNSKREDLFSTFENLPLGDTKTLEALSGTQNFNKGMKYLLDTAKNKTKTKSEAPDMT